MDDLERQSVTLRQARPEDLEFLTRTFLVSLRESIQAARGTWDEGRERAQFKEQLALAHTQVVCVDGTSVGFVTVIPRPVEVELHTLCLVPERQGRGIGSLLTQRVVTSAHAAGLPVALSVLKTNQGAARLYERLGFAKAGESQYHFRLVLRPGKPASPVGERAVAAEPGHDAGPTPRAVMTFWAATSHDAERIVRRAVPEDVGSIAAIHVRSWQAAYEGIVPAQFLAALSIEQREGVWRQTFERSTPDVWVLEEHGEVLGWISVGPSRDAGAPALTSELWALYVEPRCWRQGVGQRLWGDVEGHMRRSGFLEVTLWVLKDNARGLAFYGSNGFVVDPGTEKTIELGGAELVEIRLRKGFGG